MKTQICLLWVLMWGLGAYAQQLPTAVPAGGLDVGMPYAATGQEDISLADEDMQWQGGHEKERNIAFATSAASIIGAIYSGTRAIESRSRAKEKLTEYEGMWYSSSPEEFARVKGEYNDLREEGNVYAIVATTLGAMAAIGLGLAIYWSF